MPLLTQPQSRNRGIAQCRPMIHSFSFHTPPHTPALLRNSQFNAKRETDDIHLLSANCRGCPTNEPGGRGNERGGGRKRGVAHHLPSPPTTLPTRQLSHANVNHPCFTKEGHLLLIRNLWPSTSIAAGCPSLQVVDNKVVVTHTKYDNFWSAIKHLVGTPELIKIQKGQMDGHRSESLSDLRQTSEGKKGLLFFYFSTSGDKEKRTAGSLVICTILWT
ncbi:hypothetical protein HNY73_021999 [Argiope bruennichi]|uniref:Uncharacterized protein n=1 Tax=Argiope bruennichi TaxID=94029 RepID=A0A8T0E3L6_ARGBR|nr:hypothetical protein HNY73_021999 [Argiope bruennichi]